jgi:NitT/TauT family transport system ATP-binding protein
LPVLKDLSLEIAPGEVVALVGASGCGKSTLLRAIARLVPLTHGTIEFDQHSTQRRPGDLAYVFQEATLLPWRTVHENIGLPLELGRSIASEDVQSAITAARQAVRLDATAGDKFPHELSGGMRMRTSIARALVTDPSVLLLDEPFAALDDILRTRLNDLLLELWDSRPRTILFVTHNIAEAVYLSHRIAVLGSGRVAQWIENPLSWPRTPAQRATLEFATLYGGVSQALAEVAG